MASKLGGLKINEWLQSRKHLSVQKSLNGALVGKPTPGTWGKADVSGEATGMCTLATTVARVQASEERFAE